VQKGWDVLCNLTQPKYNMQIDKSNYCRKTISVEHRFTIKCMKFINYEVINYFSKKMCKEEVMIIYNEK
jgi:hypothetical protein